MGPRLRGDDKLFLLRLRLLSQKSPQPVAHRFGLRGRPLAHAFAGLHAQFAGPDLFDQERMRRRGGVTLPVPAADAVRREREAR